MIELHQRKHNKLVTLKQAMLQKMFPQEGATTPEVRFKGVSGHWKKYKLGDITNFINGRAYSQNELLDRGKYKVLRVGNFYTNSSWYFSDLQLGEKYYANKGDLLYTWSASFGPHIWEGDKVIYHYHIWKVELTAKLRKEFALQLLENDKERILSNSSGSTMIHITKEGMELKEVTIPQPEEQQKIGNYFRNLDKLIAQHTTQLQKLKQIKSACLEKMFV
ncbi:restriction endonuclease subunit S [Endozoicomonas sp. 8E]|uniref:restriction endonuclease subunit S n=1 Tax=Endozoicomonas sp. 8E TaxID=3035692 RepID=UPI00293947F5|nr:restriction endonuclease subunit S [Endozoicomonas sp. 8E]WOG27418.1 restriction endonuclease subunit S [Endozoicomonas sp. 8E]